MADHSKPTLTSAYSDFVTELDARLDDLALMLDPAKITASNIPTGAIRWDSASSKWQIWSEAAWGDLAATYAINALTASSAAKWTTARTLALSGDVTGSTSLDGQANKTIAAALSNTGVAAGTYKSVTVDAKGRVTGGTNPATLEGYGITDAARKDFANVTNGTMPPAKIALDASNRFFTDTERTKLSGITAGAQPNQNTFSRIVVAGTAVDADTASDTLSLVGGTGINLSANATTDTITITATILGTVSQSAGIPTGAVIERGSNASGEYVRFADGTQICHFYYTETDGAVTAAGSVFRSTTPYTWVFPAAFSTITNLSLFATMQSANAGWANARAISTGSAEIIKWVPVTEANLRIFRVVAIGRWF